MKTSTHKTISNCQAGRRPRALFAPHDVVGRPRYGHLLVSLVCLLALAPALAVAEQVDLADPAVRAAYVEQLAQKSQAEKEQAWSIAQSQGWSAKEEVGDVLFELMAIRDGRVYVNMTNNENAAISTAADMVRNTAPYNVDGTGETVGIWDGGAVLSTHQEFGSRVSVMDGAASSYHSTHVGGTVGASGVSPAAMGMAPNVDIDSYNWTNDEAEMASRGMSFAGEAGTIQVSNHSYGSASGWNWNYSPPRWYGTWGLGYREDELFGMYSDTTRWWDEICYNAPYYLPFKSAGNDRNDDAPSTGVTFSYYDGFWQTKSYDPATDPCDDGWDSGYDTVSHKGIAKNLMTVGAVDDAVLSGSRHLPNATMADFSGWGPADDGRIKPDIVGNGVDVNSCDHGHNADYHIRSGTSMSAPNASGSAILLVEYYGTLFPAQYMRASTLKGLIIHTADDLGNPGPDYSFGWGLMNTEAAAALIEEQYDNPGDDIITEGLLNGANPDDSYTIDSDGVTPIRVTLCWTDPPGTATSSPDDTAIKLVNDLDLRITGPGGSPTYYPYVLNPASRSSNATTGDNIRDNVEQVYIDSPAAGAYTIEVSHKNSLTNAQQYYSLIAGGGGAAAPGGVLVFLGQCGGGADNVTPALANLGITDVTVVYNATDFENQLASGLWDLAVVDSYAGSMPSSAMDELVNYYDGGGKVILFAWSLYSTFAGHPIVARAGVTLASDYSSTEPIYAWIESPLFTTPNPVPDMTLYDDQCGRDGQYVQPVSASAHAGYTANPTVNQAAITVNAQSRLILNAFAPQNFDQDQDTDGKIDMVELYENEINFLTGCLPPVPTNPSPPDGATGVPLDTDLSWNQALYGIRDSCDAAYVIDIYTGAPTFIGPSGVTSSTCGLAHSGGSVLYGSKPYGLTLIQVDGSGAEIRGSQGMEGMAYDPQTTTLYASINGNFYTIDRATGDVLTTLPSWPDDCEGLTFVPSVGAQGSVYGIDGDGDLHRYDVALGTFTLVGNTGLGSASDNSGLAYAADLDALFHVSKSAGDLYRIDKSTAVATWIANTGISGTNGFSGLAYGPGPGAGAAATANATGSTSQDSDGPFLTTDELGPVVIGVDVQDQGGRSSNGSLDLDVGSEASVPEPSPAVTVDVEAYNDGLVEIAAGQIDATTGEAFRPAPHQDLTAEKMDTTGGTVLWDLTHGVYFNYEPSGRFSSVVSLLASEGYTVDTTTAGVDNVDLSVYDVLVVCVGSAWYSAYTASEITAIETFVNNGGGLLVMGENTNTPNGNINPVAQAFGATCGVSYLTPDDLYFTNFAAHAIFTGCSQIYYRAAGELSASLPGQLVAWADTGEGTVAVAESGAGRIVVTGDADFCANSYIGNADNQLFAEDVFDWLAEAGTTAWYFGPSITYARHGLDVVEYGGKIYAAGGWGGGTKLEVLEAGSWSELTPMPQPQEGLCAAVTSSGKIYTFGSYGFSTITQIYDIAANSWQAGPSLPQGLYWATAECVGQYIYVIGGHPTTDKLHILDTVSGTWQVGADMPSGIQIPASAAYDNQIYVFGNGRYYKYDVAGSSWSTSTGPPSGHGSQSEAVTVGDEIYLIGGSYASIFEAYTDTEIYDCTAGTWSAGPDLNVGRYQFAAAYSGGKLYAAGGRDENAATLDSVEILDIGCAITYDVYLGTSPGSLSLVCADSPVPTCDPGSLACCRTYYWKVVAKNCCGLTEGPIWSFVTVGAGTCWDPLECAGQPNGDGTCDGYVNFADLFALKAHFGTCAPWTDPECCSDYNHSGCINFSDLFILKAGFGVSGYIPSTANQTCP